MSSMETLLIPYFMNKASESAMIFCSNFISAKANIPHKPLGNYNCFQSFHELIDIDVKQWKELDELLKKMDK